MSLTRFTTGSTSRRISASASSHGPAAEGSFAVGVPQSWRWLRYERGETTAANPAGRRLPRRSCARARAADKAMVALVVWCGGGRRE